MPWDMSELSGAVEANPAGFDQVEEHVRTGGTQDAYMVNRYGWRLGTHARAPRAGSGHLRSRRAKTSGLVWWPRAGCDATHISRSLADSSNAHLPSDCRRVFWRTRSDRRTSDAHRCAWNCDHDNGCVGKGSLE